MPNPILPKRSFTANAVPLVSDVSAEGELLVNWTDGKLFTKRDGQIVTINAGGGGSGGGLSWSAVPASETSAGAVGQIALDSMYLYLCVGENRWTRIALPLWDGSAIDNVITTEAGDVLTTEASEPILF